MYGVTSYITSQRTKEIGLRVALGAAPAELIRDTLVRGFMPVLMGIAIGAAIAFSMTRLITGYLFEVRATDPTIFVGVAAILALTGIVACYLPALRASRVDPMEVLKEG